LAKQLKLAATIKIATFFLPLIDMITGSMALELSRILTGISLDRDSHSSEFYDPVPTHELQFQELIGAYVTTMIDGFLLSIIVMIFISVIRGIMRLKNRNNKQPNQEN